MPNCQNCSAYIHSEGWCIKCGVTAMKQRRQIIKSERPKKQKSNELKNTIGRADTLFSKIIRSMYDKSGFTTCSTCSKAIRTFNGIFGSHCGHYFVKSKYWLHRWDIRNAAPQCYDCNTNREGEQVKMGEFLFKKFGVEMTRLRVEIDLFDLKLGTGMIKRQPDIMFVLEEIKRMKKM